MVSVYAPASIGNVGVGYDLLGAAVSPIDGSLLGDVVTITGEAQGDFQLSVSGSFKGSLPQDQKENIVYQCCVYFRDSLLEKQAKVPYLVLTLDKNLPVGSGLGSSATSIVAALHALNEYFEQPFEQNQLLTMMGKFEGQLSGSVHYDNVAPCYLGGLQLMVNDEDICQSLPVQTDWYWVMAYSGINVSTKMARDVLPKQICMATAIEYARNLAAFVNALHKDEGAKAGGFIRDPIAEPHRRHLLPGFDDVTTKIKAQGAIACGISGSGPTLFAITDSLEKAEKFKALLVKDYLQNEQGFCTICYIDQQGARVLPESP
jgi:homoserine kinase